MLGCEWDPAGSHAWVRASARFTRRRGHGGPILFPPSFLSAGTKGPLLIELVGRSVWRSSLSEVYLTLLLIWEPESDLAVRGLARSALSGGARRRGVGDRGPHLRAPRLSGTASAWPALPRRLCRAVSIAPCTVGNLFCKTGRLGPVLFLQAYFGPGSSRLEAGNPILAFGKRTLLISLGPFVSFCVWSLSFFGS